RIPTIDSLRENLGGFIAEEIASGVDAVSPDVENGSAPAFPLKTDVVRISDLKAEGGIEVPWLADSPRLDELNGLEIGRFEMETVRRHQLHAMLHGRLQHGGAFANRYGERLLAQHVNASLRGAHRIFPMQVVRHCNVDGVNLTAAQAFVVLLVRIRQG